MSSFKGVLLLTLLIISLIAPVITVASLISVSLASTQFDNEKTFGDFALEAGQSVELDPTTNITPSDDTFVINTYPSTNYGISRELHLGQLDDGAWDEDIFLKFSLPSMGIVSAKLHLNCFYWYENDGRCTSYVYAVDNDDWLENEITWDNKPTRGGSLASLILDSSGWKTWESGSLTEFVENQRTIDSIVSLSISIDYLWWGPIKFYSSESPVGDPYLEVTYVWAGSTTFKLENLYELNLYKANLWLYDGMKLVVKFYDYDNVFENENVIHENFTLPWQVVPENENVAHPSGVSVKRARLDLTGDNTENVISTISSFVVTRDVLWDRLTQISGEWPFASSSERDALWKELGDLSAQWPYAPS